MHIGWFYSGLCHHKRSRYVHSLCMYKCILKWWAYALIHARWAYACILTQWVYACIQTYWTYSCILTRSAYAHFLIPWAYDHIMTWLIYDAITYRTHMRNQLFKKIHISAPPNLKSCIHHPGRQLCCFLPGCVSTNSKEMSPV